MSSYDLNERQREFAAAILNPDLPIPAGVIGPDGNFSPKRFAVYRNNCVAGIVGVLKSAYPATCRIVGDEFFRAMARIYVAREPPSSPVMLDYGEGFPAFIDAFEPAEELAYLGDVARLERAWVEAYHAAEAQPMDVAALRCIQPEVFPRLRLLVHPSTRVVRSIFPVVTLWQMNVTDATPCAPDIGRGAEDALILRPGAEVEVRTLNPGAADFLRTLMEGGTVAAAAALALENQPCFDLAATLTALLATGALSDIEDPALDRDHHGVRSVLRPQLGQNALHVCLDGALRD